jgi:nucleotide-binding universal stress UspA family protein
MRFRLDNVATNSANALRRVGLFATSEVMDGDPREAILTLADLVIADTIFVGARGLGRMERLLLGSVSSYIITHARCTVEVVRDHTRKHDQQQSKSTLAVCV